MFVLFFVMWKLIFNHVNLIINSYKQAVFVLEGKTLKYEKFLGFVKIWLFHVTPISFFGLIEGKSS